MTGTDRSLLAFALAAAALLAAQPFLPDWLAFLITTSLARGLVVASIVLLMRAGLVSFGQGLFFCLGGYAAGYAGSVHGVTETMVLLALAVAVPAVVAAVLGLLLSRYRDIFFAMFTLAFSMILYGLIAKTEALGSTDGFGVPRGTFFGFAPPDADWQAWLFRLTVVLALGAAALLHRYLRSPAGFAGEAVRENEIRVQYLGTSPRRVIYLRTVLAATIAGLGGGLTALGTGHVAPEMAYWTTSGEFVFVALLSGTGHIGAGFAGSFLFSLIQTYALELTPYTWQMILGGILLATILFLPKGLWSLVAPRRGGTAP